MRFSLGLTGSIGMGKSTTAKMLSDRGCDVWDADAVVHRLYGVGGAAISPLRDLFPDAIDEAGVNRTKLKEIISSDPSALCKIENIVHPLVAQDRAAFRQNAKSDILVFDIPLLFENNSQTEMDAVACVFVDSDTQRHRVLNRKTMSQIQFDQIVARQMPIADKLSKSDYRIETDTLQHAQEQVDAILDDIRRKLSHA